MIADRRIDGSDRLVINSDGASWEHKFWAWPTAVSLNDVRWDPKENSYLANDGVTRFLSPDIDFSTARILGRSGRDLVAMERQVDGVVIVFADNPVGRAEYEVSIGFEPERNNQ